ncbi:hypothetical protein F5Y18DRAFT_119820 [Xylariaceae sp. FL1019]|nr:hypothetical protein F5Y18DRAFT_119820 [Xylariaceae sp. FL1019]
MTIRWCSLQACSIPAFATVSLLTPPRTLSGFAAAMPGGGYLASLKTVYHYSESGLVKWMLQSKDPSPMRVVGIDISGSRSKCVHMWL